MGFYEPKKGDRVRVVLEGEAHSLDVSRREKCFGIGANYINPENEHVMSVEKVEPPVVTFKPGDTVRAKSGRHPLNTRTLGHSTYWNHGLGEAFKYDGKDGEVREHFTSDRYELVELK